MLNRRVSLVSVLFLLITTTATGWATARSPAKFPTLGGEPGNDLTCEPIPDAAKGHFVCEDKESYDRCKMLESTGKVHVNGAKEATPVVKCQQGG
ncbi:MAG: hypothetical protein ABIO61_03280 [Thermomonas sp.]